ncbi:mechanosensitive ion channel family protein [Rhizobacter sp. Root1221]|uniref:mechanosensitive ion channel family protein n=1 Tax=Rhizobacter sp. Root1221 TaxID=1736433 RepID=UPI0006FC05F2|nr:mechanosensitive ion channel domain-containing protein [Rhizobacter sp. Root1221]KQV90177.1 mechanosensitive ion channel protein [Rhizobacter sp. Root1221]
MQFDELNKLVAEFTTASALTGAGVLAGSLLASWLVCSLLRRMLKIEGAVLFGRRTIDGVLFPVLALLFALLTRFLFTGVMSVAVFKVAIPILSSLLAIRLSVRVLSYAFPTSQWARSFERTVSWLAWIGAVLWITGILPAVLEELDDIRLKIGGANVSVRTMLEGSLTAAVVMVLALWLSAAIEKKVVKGTGNDLSLRKVAANLVRVVLLFLGLIFAMSAVGINLTALSVLGGAAGVGIGFGMQKIAANYVSGFVILAERSLRIGDTVKVDNFEGRISDIRTRYTVIRATNGREAIVPNELLITQRVENASLVTAESQVLISVVVQVAYGTDVRSLQPKLEAALAGNVRVLTKPAPVVQLTNFIANGMELTIKYWLTDPNNEQDRVKSEVNLAILDALNMEKVEFPGPQRVVFHGLGAVALDDKTG